MLTWPRPDQLRETRDCYRYGRGAKFLNAINGCWSPASKARARRKVSDLEWQEFGSRRDRKQLRYERLGG